MCVCVQLDTFLPVLQCNHTRAEDKCVQSVLPAAAYATIFKLRRGVGVYNHNSYTFLPIQPYAILDTFLDYVRQATTLINSLL